MSGSKGEANFVWKCKNCKVYTTPLRYIILALKTCRESTMRTLRQRRPPTSNPIRPRQ